jgi:hypothetical protein
MAMPTTRVALSAGSLYDLSLADSIGITGNSDTARNSPEGKAILLQATLKMMVTVHSFQTDREGVRVNGSNHPVS